MMYRREAVRRLREHFRIHDDGKPTPYLDEAVEMACDALDRMDQILEKFGTFDRVMAAEEVVHCRECAMWHPENGVCNKPHECMRCRFPDEYCSDGRYYKLSDIKLMERRAGRSDLFTRKYILSAEEEYVKINTMKNLMEATIECEPMEINREWTLAYCRNCRQPIPIIMFDALTLGTEGWTCPLCTMIARMRRTRN